MVPIVLMYREIQTITQFNRTIVFKRTLLGSILTMVMLLGVLIAGLILGWIFPPNGRVSSMIYIIVIGGLGVAIYGALGLWLRYFDRFIGGQAARLRQKISHQINLRGWDKVLASQLFLDCRARRSG